MLHHISVCWFFRSHTFSTFLTLGSQGQSDHQSELIGKYKPFLECKQPGTVLTALPAETISKRENTKERPRQAQREDDIQVAQGLFKLAESRSRVTSQRAPTWMGLGRVSSSPQIIDKGWSNNDAFNSGSEAPEKSDGGESLLMRKGQDSTFFLFLISTAKKTRQGENLD